MSRVPYGITRFFVSCALLLLLASVGYAPLIPTVHLTPQTVAAFDAYVRGRESRMDARLNGQRPYLWVLEKPERIAAVRANGVHVDPPEGNAVVHAPDGLIHDWAGATFIRGATVEQVLALLQDYERHKVVFAPEVIESRLTARDGDHFTPFLRLRKQKVITVVLNSDYDVIYRSLQGRRAYSRSYSTRIAELDGDRELPVGDDHGFLWRLYAYWRIAEADGGVWVECESISLSRGLPAFLRTMLNPILKELPRESLQKTLLAARRALEKG